MFVFHLILEEFLNNTLNLLVENANFPQKRNYL